MFFWVKFNLDKLETTCTAIIPPSVSILASGVTKLNIWHGYFTDILHGKYVTVLWVEENFLGISKLKLLNFKLLSNFTLLDDL